VSGAGCSHGAVSTTYVDGVRLCRSCGVPVFVVPVAEARETIARALCKLDHYGGDVWDEVREDERDEHLGHADAVLAALVSGSGQ